jgi:hypothetical protein
MISKDCPLIFTHIPKTGGMSLFAAMCQYHGMKMADMYNISARDIDKAPIEELLSDQEKSVFAGHFPFGLHEWLSRPSCYMAIVRKPLDRIISLYYYSIQFRDITRNARKETGLSYQALFDNRTIPDFYVDFLPWIKGEQTQTKFLRCLSAELDNGMVRRFSGVGLHAKRCPKEALDKAKGNIEKYFSLVGVQERFQDTVHLASAMFGVNFTEYHINKGVDKKNTEQKLSLKMRQRINEMNRLDNDLYQWVVDRFDKNMLNPSKPIIIPGGSRTDYGEAKLWHAIGSSPKRQGAMELSPANQ